MVVIEELTEDEAAVTVADLVSSLDAVIEENEHEHEHEHEHDDDDDQPPDHANATTGANAPSITRDDNDRSQMVTESESASTTATTDAMLSSSPSLLEGSHNNMYVYGGDGGMATVQTRNHDDAAAAAATMPPYYAQPTLLEHQHPPQESPFGFRGSSMHPSSLTAFTQAMHPAWTMDAAGYPGMAPSPPDSMSVADDTCTSSSTTDTNHAAVHDHVGEYMTVDGSFARHFPPHADHPESGTNPHHQEHAQGDGIHGAQPSDTNEAEMSEFSRLFLEVYLDAVRQPTLDALVALLHLQSTVALETSAGTLSLSNATAAAECLWTVFASAADFCVDVAHTELIQPWDQTYLVQMQARLVYSNSEAFSAACAALGLQHHHASASQSPLSPPNTPPDARGHNQPVICPVTQTFVLVPNTAGSFCISKSTLSLSGVFSST
ncbi:hypothetical protein CAOG_02850 [Capsaspora owczarzaki ATCC 30864]|uniref:Uncharacterized protein n=1 Tax=Capsaspora owczarzaki (strain ATCC 30864) TaxID=595528 RepID=A0A0D2X213_CAPO3|nr:hypothetical protein CAOG_02850 [Capsaspora owczarzaki ATCC 30864]KJE91759.1 hypothetical protein CAOG_002850 [Capsaspora owczarzaki ATCC 30864]|eukprot:XP_004348663.1 hypothetical protein CAOG_02850 [Capsaspora owczarzaki ATCC 30864]